MNIVILGVGGMGVISLSKTIANMAMNKHFPVRSSEIHGMAKKGGLVEVHLKIDGGLSPMVGVGQADYVIILDDKYKIYAENFADGDKLISLKNEEKIEIMNKFGSVMFANSFILGKFLKKQDTFCENDAIKVLENFKKSKENINAFKKGIENDI